MLEFLFDAWENGVMTPLMATFVDATPAPGTGVGVVAAGSLPAQAPAQAVQAAPGVSGVSSGWPGLVSSCSDSELVVRIGEWERRIRLARKHQ
ncbi:hypothetical protein ABT324_19635, partial [Saccharopolyspora sp. NPDC000359]|uniref:hypothetical protein n=1 Tax=Saccharopolyspora sp. NPDC000359 TaxID=3154251 RepID=UPI00332FDF08